MMNTKKSVDWRAAAVTVKRLGGELGFQQVGITDTALDAAEVHLRRWLAQRRHGDMQWMAQHGVKRTRPAALIPGTLRVISARMNYLPVNAAPMQAALDDAERAYISRYAVGRDYHKLMRKRLQKLAEALAEYVGQFGFRVFVDSAPVMEKPLAEKAGLGWIGKHTNLLHRRAGSWFFLGEIYTDMPLPVDQAAHNHCGDCQACIDVCPTNAITAPYQLDARLCISYLTIEHRGAIPAALRPLIGNRIYGCDDCQLCCPWNRFADFTQEVDFHPRHRLDDISLLEVFAWDEAAFLDKTKGSAIRRIGHQRWLRNIAVALGNCTTNRAPIITALKRRHEQVSDMVKEHIDWAVKRLGRSLS